MEKHWRRIGSGLGRRWVAVLVGFLVITAILLVGAANLDFATGQDSYLDDDDQIAIDNELFQEEFGGETIILLFEATDGADVSEILSRGDNLAELQRLEQELRDIPQVYSVLSPLTSLQYSANIIESGAGTDAVLNALPRETDEDGAAARQADVATTLARLPGEEERELGNPTWDEFLLFSNENVEVVDGEPQMPTGDERVVRSSLRSTFPNLQTAVGGVIIEGNADLDTLAAGTEAVVDVMESAELDGFEVTVTGSPLFLKDINDYLQGGMLTLGAIALVVMAVILTIMFRVRWRYLPLLSTVVGVLWGFAVLGYIGIDLSLVTISGLPILIGLGIDFAIQVHNRIEEESALDKEAHPIAETVANMGPALVAATVSAVVAFTALQISQVPMIRDFGVMLSIGIVALVFCGIVIPATVLGVREFKSRTKELPETWVERVVVWLGSLPPKSAVPLLIASVALFIGGVALEERFEIESDPVKWINQESQTVENLDRLAEATGFESNLGILVTANNVLTDEVTQVLHEFTLYAESLEDVSASSSLVGTVAKIIEVPGATPLPPTSADMAAAAEAMPEDVAKALLTDDDTATQINLRLAPASLEERAEIVERLEADLEQRLDELELPEDSILLQGLDEDDPAIRATPAGLAVVGVGLLDNLSANRAGLTYLGLAVAALWLLIRFRSLGRAALTLVPVGLAIGTSSVVIGAFGLTLSPLTTVSGPLVIAACTEFSVVITARYLEERQVGKQPREASDHAARRTGRAFFTSACTTIGGFAVLIGSALPLLRDFGIIVTMNVAVALFAALVVMPPLLVWADARGWFPVEGHDPRAAVKLAAHPKGLQLAAFVGAVVVLAGTAIALYANAEKDSGESIELAYQPVALPTTTTTTTTTAPAAGISLDDYPDARPDGLVQGTVFDLLTAQGADPRAANCTHEQLLAGTPEPEVLALAGSDQAALFDLVSEAAATCTVPQDVIDAAVAAGL
ncbi:MAG TPA: MMPL family transporter [Acidimicrobiales bacterium]|nr:MMPL family transporter [Acidimicrobiales bacterium]